MDLDNKVNDLMKEWIIFRDECLSRITEEDKGHLIEFDKYCDNMKNVASCNKKYVQKQLDKFDENYLDYIGYWNDKLNLNKVFLLLLRMKGFVEQITYINMIQEMAD